MSRLSWLFIATLFALHFNIEVEYDGLAPAISGLLLFIACVGVPFYNVRKDEEEWKW